MYRAKTRSYYSHWVTGHFITSSDDMLHYINNGNESILVYRASVCQSTGKLDRNQVMMYNRDIVKLIKTNGREKRALIKWDEEKLRYVLKTTNRHGEIKEVPYEPYMVLEVIGNELDNPYLLDF